MSAVSIPQSSPFLVVFGRDAAGKPHASWFDQASAELATKAAALMNMHAVPVDTDAPRELAGSLPRGRVFSSGRAFTPFVKGKLYSSLVELTRDILGLSQSDAANEDGAAAGDQATQTSEADDATKAAGAEAMPKGIGKDAGRPPQPSKRPTRPEDVAIGSLVLAPVAPEEGWYEAEVIGSNGASVTLRYADYPEEGAIVRRRSELGYLPPAQG